MNIDHYVPYYYLKEQYETCYKSMIYPTKGNNIWTKTKIRKEMTHNSREKDLVSNVKEANKNVSFRQHQLQYLRLQLQPLQSMDYKISCGV